MNTERDFERITMDWLNAGSDSTPHEVIDAVLLAVRSMPQERDLRISWRALSMRLAVTAATVITVVVILGLAAYFALGPRANVGTDSTPSPTLPAAQAPSPAATPHGSPVETSGWTTFQSARYGFSIGHPSDWTEVPADHDWALATDAGNWLSTGQEVFKAPGDAIRVSAWSEPIDGSAMTDASDIEAWVQTYCEQLNSGPCNGIHDRVVPLCIEKRDCHPGLLVPFKSDVQAFLTGGIYADRMVVVAVWWGESAPAVAQYGGAQRLLEAFLSTMSVWPESVPVDERV